MKRSFVAMGVVAFALLVGAVMSQVTARAAAEATAKSKGVKIGDASPEWKELEGVDGKKHSLADLKESKAVLVVFTCNHCPVAQAYEDRLNALQKDYHEKGVEIVAVNVNNLNEDKMPAMQAKAKAKGFEFEYLYDPSQKIGRAFGATVTPHVFVLDGEKKVAYIGAIDDEMNASRVKTHYVREALNAVLEGKAPATPETKPSGCGIVYE